MSVYRGKNGFVSARFRGSLAEKVKALGEGAKDALRPAAQAGAQVFYDEMLQRVPVESGKLRRSIYQFYLERKSSDYQHVYVIGPNKTKAPHWHLVEFGHWLYNRYADGLWLQSKSKKSAKVQNPPAGFKQVHDLPGARDEPLWVPAVPYIRPTLDAVGVQAVEAMKRRLSEALRESNSGWQ